MTKLCPRGKAAAKRKFKVYPSAYANAYASRICAGKIKDPSGVKRKDFRGSKAEGGPAENDTRFRKLGERKKLKREEKTIFDLKGKPKPKLKKTGMTERQKMDLKLSKERRENTMAGGGLMEATARLKKQGLRGGGISQRGLGRAFMKGGRV